MMIRTADRKPVLCKCVGQAALVGLTMIAGACSTRTSGHQEPLGTNQAALTNPTGTAPPSSISVKFKGVHDFDIVTNECRGTVVARHWVLTAKHCFQNTALDSTLFAASGTLGLGANGDHKFLPKDVYLPPDVFSPQDLAIPKCGTVGRTLKDAYSHQTPHANELVGALDVALVHYASGLTNPIAKLWHPAQSSSPSGDLDPSIAGRLVTLTGTDADESPLSSQTRIAGTFFFHGAPVLGAAYSPDETHLEEGDSGGGLFIAGSELPKPSQAFPSMCAPQPGGVGDDLVLVGVNSFSDTNALADYFAPVYGSPIVEWIANTIAEDEDHDGVCDVGDNCVSVCNPDQRNCNKEAEDAWGGHRHLGDACDPTPCPQPSLAFHQTVQGTGTAGAPFGDGPSVSQIIVRGLPSIILTNVPIATGKPARRVEDFMDILPVLGPSGAVSSQVTPRFCHCRDDEGRSISDPGRCQQTFFCKLDGKQVARQANQDITEIGFNPAQPPVEGETVWHELTLAGQERGAALAITYPGSKSSQDSYAGPAIQATWDYQADDAFWVDEHHFFPAAPAATGYPAGTDLGGALWAHDRTEAGSIQHGMSCSLTAPPGQITPECNVADAFAWGIAPDPRTTVITDVHWIPAPPIVGWDRPCLVCGDRFRFPGDELINPAPFVTFTTQTLDAILWRPGLGGMAVDPWVSSNLRLGLFDPQLRWVAASEPSGTCNVAGCSKAFALSADATRVADVLAVTEQGFKQGLADDLLHYDSEQQVVVNQSDGVIPDEVARMIQMPGPTARVGYAATWSRTAGALYVIGGRDPETGVERADIWKLRQGSEPTWSSVPLDPNHVPRDVRAAVFSPADWRVWVIDRRTFVFQDHLFIDDRLLRIDPETGRVDMDLPVPVLKGYAQVWLSTVEDGRVLLSAATASSHVIALLDSGPFSPRTPVRVIGAHFGEGELVGGPIVGYDLITLPVGHTEGGIGIGTVAPTALSPADLTETWPALALQIAPDENRNGVPDSLESCVSVNTFSGFIAGGPAAPLWTPDSAYSVGDRATFDDETFEAVQAHTSLLGWEPPNVPALWEIPTPCGTSLWAPQTRYVVGSEVIFNGQIFEAIQAHTSQVGWDPESVPALWQTQPPSPGADWMPQTAYVVGSEVTFGGATYLAIQAHTSQIGWEPPNTPALWQAP
jgi:hypothetical protein